MTDEKELLYLAHAGRVAVAHGEEVDLLKRRIRALRSALRFVKKWSSNSTTWEKAAAAIAADNAMSKRKSKR